MTSGKIKGRYFFGVDAATSIVPQAGSGNLTYTAGSGGATFNSNYVDLKTGSYFQTPFNSVSHDRTIIVVGSMPFYERVFDGDSTYKFPPVVSPVVTMSTADNLMSQTVGGYVTLAGSSLSVGLAGGSTFATPGTYDMQNPPNAYRDGSFTSSPQIYIFGQGVDGVGTYVSFTVGRNNNWLTNTTAYSSFAAAPAPMRFGHMAYSGSAGSTASTHVPLLAYAEYSRLTPTEAALEATDMITLLEARGWTGLFHNPFTSEARPADNSPTVPASQPSIVAANANFTVAASPTAGWTRITKTGGTNGTMERAAYTAAALSGLWYVSIADPVSGGTQFQAGVTKSAGPVAPPILVGVSPSGASPATYMNQYTNGASASSQTRTQGEIYGVTRKLYGVGGYLTTYIGPSPDGVYPAATDYSNGQTDAAVPVIFDCALATIGGYIDVKLS